MKNRIKAKEYREQFGQKVSKKKPTQHESELQKQCVKWFRIKYPDYILFSIPNGGSRNAIEAKRLKAEGVLAGVADLQLLFGNGSYNALFIEMKVGKNKQSANQIAFQEYCDNNNYKYIVCYSFEEFENIVTDYLKKN